MRLRSAELEAIRANLAAMDPHGAIYLFGSRVDDARRGGDIDVFLEATRSIDLKSALAMEYRLTCACDTKVDLLIKSPQDPEKTIFAIARQGIKL